MAQTAGRTRVRFPVVMRGRVPLGDSGPVEHEVELRVARQSSLLMARPVGAGDGDWRTWSSWDTAEQDPVGDGERRAAQYGVTGLARVPRAPLTVADVVSLAAIVDAAARGLRVARVVDVGDGIVWGTARHIVTDDQAWGLPDASDDVRDCLLRVTMSSGFEQCWPVDDLVRDHQAAMFVTDYRPGPNEG